jgi:hypothetical protein
LKFISSWFRRLLRVLIQSVVRFYPLLVICVFVYFRIPSILNNSSFNPDEAELLAQGKRAALDLVPFRSFTTATYGPSWPLFLASLNKLSLPLTLPIAHLLSAILGSSICVVFFKGLSNNLNRSIAVGISFPLVLMWAGGFGHSDYLSLATELLPSFFFVLGIYLCFCCGSRTRNVYLGMFFITMAAWTKYNFFPIVLATLIFVVRNLLSKKQSVVRPVLMTFLIVCLFPALILICSILFRVQNDLVLETWKTTYFYIRGGGIAITEPPPITQRISQLCASFLSLFPLFVYFLLGVGLFALKFSSNVLRNSLLIGRDLIFPFSVFITGVGSLLVMWPVFPHYNHLLIVSTITLLLISSSHLPQSLKSYLLDSECRLVRLCFSFSICVFAFLLALPTLHVGRENIFPLTKLLSAESYGTIRDRTDNLLSVPLSTLCPAGSVVIVWGWSSELYSYYDWKPGSRYVNTLALMAPSPLNSNPQSNREVFLNEFTRSNPKCVVDATGPSFFPNYPQSISLQEQMPEFVKVLSNSYSSHVVYWDSVNPVQVFSLKNDNIELFPFSEKELRIRAQYLD